VVTSIAEQYTDSVLRLEVRKVGKWVGEQCGNGMDLHKEIKSNISKTFCFHVKMLAVITKSHMLDML
jgi:hypothetical protein